ncbi:MAG: Crp/Fnr family transcriptional regulator [Caulobacteraceae bacterium]
MSNPFINKLEHGAELTREDRAKLGEIASRTRNVDARVDLIHEGETPGDVRLILEGLACRYKVLPDGARQIMAYLIPGDFCDLHVAILGEMDHSIATLSPCKVVEISRETIDELLEHYPRIARALWWCTLVDEGTLREWLVSMGRRPADRQMAHLFCELLARLQAVGHAGEDSFELPLTQEELGDTLGLSAVHVNRVLQSLRAERLISFQHKTLKILNVPRLKEFAGFNPSYLHLGRKRATAVQRTRKPATRSHLDGGSPAEKVGT